ncbi:MAG: hypothetical protein KC468_20470 [Myxococcales bacterium]|nr:hypothetical protein [Myxococcales bacterium]
MQVNLRRGAAAVSPSSSGPAGTGVAVATRFDRRRAERIAMIDRAVIGDGETIAGPMRSEVPRLAASFASSAGYQGETDPLPLQASDDHPPAPSPKIAKTSGATGA